MRDPSFEGEQSTCATCGKPITGYIYSQWNGFQFDELDKWWSHHEHPADGHDAEPVEEAR